VLVVEDDDSVRHTTAEILSIAGYLAEQVSDGAQAVSLLSAGSFDAVVLDLDLPGLDGLWVLESQLGPPPVIIVSALEYYDRHRVAAQMGTKIFAVLRKPVDPDLLLSTLREALAEA
jgi:DNA-binding response OmpR family regulator